MLVIHHRPDIYDRHVSDVDPQTICHYPLDDNEPTTQQIPGHVSPTGRNIMSTETSGLPQAIEPRITAAINTTVELDPSFWNGGKLPALPAHLGTPTVSWGFDGAKIETRVRLSIDGDQTASFWDTDEDGILNTAHHDRGDGLHPWDTLATADFAAAIKWGESVHARILHGAEQVTTAAASPGSEAYNAVIQFAVGRPAEAPVFEVHDLGEDGDSWLVTGAAEETHPSRVKTEVAKYLVGSLGVGYDGLADLIGDLKDAKAVFRDNWVLAPVDPNRPDEGSLLKPDEEADHALPRFAATLVTI